MERCATGSRSCSPVGSALWCRCYFRKPRVSRLYFHPIPFRGDPTGLEPHYLPKRGKADKAVLSFFAQEQESRVVCYANANLTRRDQAGETVRFVEFWYPITGRDPEWLYFDVPVFVSLCVMQERFQSVAVAKLPAVLSDTRPRHK